MYLRANQSLLDHLVMPQFLLRFELLHLCKCNLCSFVFLHSTHSESHLRARPHWDESTSATVEKKQSQVHLQHRCQRENLAGITSREESQESVSFFCRIPSLARLTAHCLFFPPVSHRWCVTAAVFYFTSCHQLPRCKQYMNSVAPFISASKICLIYPFSGFKRQQGSDAARVATK